MTTQTKSAKPSSDAFEQVMENFRKTSEAALEMQQEVYRQWTKGWDGFPQPHTAWIDQARDFQKDWAHMVTEFARKYRETLDKQYRDGIKALEEAFRVSQSKDPAQLGKRAEEFCRNALECMRDSFEAQITEFQDMSNRWLELMTNAGK